MLPPLRLLALLAALGACAAALPAADVRTLTAKDGRSIEAEILGHRGDTLRIRRSDTGREIRLPLSALADDDQKAARQFIRDNPDLRDAVKPNDIRVEFTRAKFERQITSDTSWRDENTESWGYSIAVLNQTNQPIEGLRVEYIVYGRNDPDNVQSTSRNKTDSENLLRVRGREEIPAIASGQRATVRTEPVVTTRVKYTDGGKILTADGKLRGSWRDKALHGVWFRVYDGDKLVQEASSPDSLRTSERWDGGN